MKTRTGLALVVASILTASTCALKWSDSINRETQLRSQLQPGQEYNNIWDDELTRTIASNSLEGLIWFGTGVFGGALLLSYGSEGLFQNYRNIKKSKNYSFPKI